MKTIYNEILNLAKPYLQTRANDIHVAISIQFAHKLLRMEGGEAEIVIPAIILHDVAWKMIPEELQIKAFGPNATRPELNSLHEEEGAKIAKQILKEVKYPEKRTIVIVEIIEGHDSRKKALSLNDKIVKDADRLWRYTKQGFDIDIKRFGETYQEGIQRLDFHFDKWFYTNSARNLALEELTQRKKESR